MIRVTDRIAIDPRDLRETFIRASGPGGQNVNKVATAVQLRFDLGAATGIPDAVRARLASLAGRRVTRDGALLITAQRHRTQERNRQDAMAALIQLIRRAAVPPRRRVPTKPTQASRGRRLAAKSHRGGIKRLRAGVADET